jgi:hypothetical protein
MGSPAPGIPNAGLGEPLAGSVDAAGGSDRLNTASLKRVPFSAPPQSAAIAISERSGRGGKLQRLLRIN